MSRVALTMRVAASFLLCTLLLCDLPAKGQNAESLLDQGIEAFHKGEYLPARNLFQRVVTISPADSRAITYLAVTRAMLGDCSQSVEELHLQAYRNSDLELRRIAGLACVQCLLPQNRFADILPLLAQLQRTFPSDPDVLYQAANVYNKASNHTVFELFQRANSSYRVNQVSAEVFEGQGKYAEAAAEYRKAIQKNPIALGLRYRLARALLLLRDPAMLEGAREQLEGELKLNPRDPLSLYQLGQTFLAQKKGKEAGEQFEKAAEVAPRFAEALVELGKLRLEEKETGEAVAVLERAVKAKPELQAAHYQLMLAYTEAGKKKDAQREQKAIERLRGSNEESAVPLKQ